MMDISDADDLLAIARQTLLGEIVPALPDNRRYKGLMVANAIAIAAREQRLGAEAACNESARLRRLTQDVGLLRRSSGVTVPAELSTLRRTVRDAIRAGAFDAPSPEAALVAALQQIANDQVAIANPKALRDRA